MLSRLLSPAMAGSIVRRMREERGMSRAALSSVAGVSPRTLYSLEEGEGENPGLGNLMKVLDALGLSLCIDDGQGDRDAPVPQPPQGSSSPLGAWEELPSIWQIGGGAS